MSVSAKLLLNDGTASCDAIEYRHTIGSLQYLSLTHPDIGFAQTNPVRGFSDANWGGNLDDRKSTTAYIIFLGNNSISWRAWKQKAIARLSTKAEYRALATGLKYGLDSIPSK
ncbi:hypothetical protein F2P56_024333 [Juglans regia]|uniref:Secreted RxLR effector protein 161-like n=1 Tax=Juglans regia TaxID=51240 RepID=A0A833TSC3_JUGRE|nr:hypothetical protein F2P56_024333 [Juglans regia]